ncbi:MAG: glycosyltransferase family 2 protein [Cyclobacteriaceae bacterium]|jgi:glycosyltransferase involved in cell wall biosynthesis
MNVLVSVIMPVYNVEKYVAASIQSILSQTFESFELILVNDGSTDSSPIICEEYLAKDSRVKLIHQKNAGFGSARNTGLRFASGQYIYFMDSDDLADPHLLNDNYKLANELSADCLLFGHRKIYSTGKAQNTVEMVPPRSSKEPINVVDLIDSGFGFAVWEQLIKNSLIIENNILFPTFKREADVAFLLELYKFTNLVFTNPQLYYSYNSFYTTHKFNQESLKNHKELYRRLSHLVELKSLEMDNGYIKAKFFTLWFYHVVPINYVASNLPFRQKVNGLRELLNDSELEKWQKGLVFRGLIVKFSHFVFSLKNSYVIWLFTSLKISVKRNISLNYKKMFYS